MHEEKKSYEDGYTLTELLIVLVIIALLTGLVAPRLIGRVGGAKTTTAKAQIENLVSALDIYKLDVGEFPTEEQGLLALVLEPEGVEGWQGPYMRKGEVPNDPWNVPYLYKFETGSEFPIVYSYGKDRREGGEGENADIEGGS